MTYKVKLNFFEGPLDLLLFLIKREKIDIYDIPIADITEQYLQYIEIIQLLDLELAGDFLVMASNLVYIKSKMLLPREESEIEEDIDPRQELVEKLLEYKKFKEASEGLRDLMSQRKEYILREGDFQQSAVFTDPEGDYFEASLFDLISAFRKVVKRIPKEAFHEVVREKFTVADKMHEIFHLLTETPRVKFTEVFLNAKNKDEIIATFLAVLELMKMKEVLVVQKDSFGEIEIVRNPEMVNGTDK